MQDRDTPIDEATAAAGEFDFAALAVAIKHRGRDLGFADVGISRADPSPEAISRLLRWLDCGHHGGMDYMAKHASLRISPGSLLPGTLSVISARLPYWKSADSQRPLTDPRLARISRYALGRDYHKIVRQRLKKLADFIQSRIDNRASPNLPPAFACRVFSDSAPVMETEFARLSGIGWRGKHTLSLTREGSWHFLGEIFTNLPLPSDPPTDEHCGRCRRCLEACPTGAIIAPYELDARLCISYWTIEWSGAIPEEYRTQLGNRIYGCDDCQSACPWNRFARLGDPAFATRHGLDAAPLAELFGESETSFEERFAGSPIRRIGHERWLRNLAVALGNAPPDAATVAALQSRADHPSGLVREHVAWALRQIEKRPDGRSCFPPKFR